jgi:uncharacterized membrane protein HdeD (DUF308 family)
LIQTLVNNRLWLALSGVLEAIISVEYFIMQGTDGPLTFHSWNGTVMFLGKLGLAAGAGTITAGVLRSKNGKCWPLVLNGLALVALGLIQYAFVHSPISFLTVALLIVLMAMSIGILELAIARTLPRQRHLADGWVLTFAGVASVGFALAFLALGFRWIKIEPGSHVDLLWLGAYFGFSALCRLGAAARLHGRGLSPSGGRQALPPFGNARHAH